VKPLALMSLPLLGDLVVSRRLVFAPPPDLGLCRSLGIRTVLKRGFRLEIRLRATVEQRRLGCWLFPIVPRLILVIGGAWSELIRDQDVLWVMRTAPNRTQRLSLELLDLIGIGAPPAL
jgi:hypothetical protein